jgi:hypothetical protein
VHLHAEHFRLTCFAKKGEIKESNPNGTPKTLISFKGQQKSIKGEKLGCKLEGDQTKHLQGWTTSPRIAN